jgi:hypothetical protein
VSSPGRPEQTFFAKALPSSPGLAKPRLRPKSMYALKRCPISATVCRPRSGDSRLIVGRPVVLRSVPKSYSHPSRDFPDSITPANSCSPTANSCNDLSCFRRFEELYVGIATLLKSSQIVVFQNIHNMFTKSSLSEGRKSLSLVCKNHALASVRARLRPSRGSGGASPYHLRIRERCSLQRSVSSRRKCSRPNSSPEMIVRRSGATAQANIRRSPV